MSRRSWSILWVVIGVFFTAQGLWFLRRWLLFVLVDRGQPETFAIFTLDIAAAAFFFLRVKLGSKNESSQVEGDVSPARTPTSEPSAPVRQTGGGDQSVVIDVPICGILKTGTTGVICPRCNHDHPFTSEEARRQSVSIQLMVCNGCRARLRYHWVDATLAHLD